MNNKTPISGNIKSLLTFLCQEVSFLKKQNNILFKSRKEDKLAINQINQNIENILLYLTKQSPQVDPITTLSPSIHLSIPSNEPIISLLELKDCQIVSGSSKGSIFLSEIDYLTKKWSISSEIPKAHKDSIYSLCEISKQRFVSCSKDEVIKIWDYSIRNVLKNLTTLTNTSGTIMKVISLTNDRIASCSYDTHMVKIWEGEEPFDVINTIYNQTNANCIIQLRKRYEMLCVCCAVEEGFLEFYDLFVPFKKRGTIIGVQTDMQNGMVELGNGDVALSKGGNESCIYIVDPVRYIKLAEVVDRECIVNAGPLLSFGRDSILYEGGKWFCQIVMEDGEYKVGFKLKSENGKMFTNNMMIKGEGKKCLIVTCSGGINVVEY